MYASLILYGGLSIAVGKIWADNIPAFFQVLLFGLQICCIGLAALYTLLRANSSVRWAFLLYLVSLFIGYFAYIVAYNQSTLPENSLWSFWLFCFAFLLCWCLFSLMIDNDVSELVNESITTIITVFTLIVNLFLLSLPENSFWQKIQLPFNLFIAPFLLTSSISSVLVAMQKYCLKKYGGDSQKHTEDDGKDGD